MTGEKNMGEGVGSLIWRKVISTYVVTAFFSALLAFFYIKNSTDVVYNQEEHFVSWFILYFMYMGCIVLLYGNFVSIFIEFLQKKYFHHHDWLYVLILGAFGLANGIIFQEITLAIYGMLAAILFALIDKWLYKRKQRSKRVHMSLLIPIGLFLILWSYFNYTATPMPPFTKEDAVKYATSNQGLGIEHFPKEIGKWKGTINGYQVKRETIAKEVEKEVYLVSFKESWKKGAIDGYYIFSYKIERGSLSAQGSNGTIPPYFEGD
jgi:hypothetical protein